MSHPDKMRAVDEGVSPEAWRRVSWVTPILNSWKAIVAIVAILVFQNIDLLWELREVGLLERGVLWVLLWVGGAIVVLLALIFVYSYFSWRAMTYAVTDQAVWLRKGIFFRSQRHVRFERVQSVDMVHPLLGRIFGLGKLTVEAAGGSGSNLSIGFLTSAQLAALRNEVLAGAAGIRQSSQEPRDASPPTENEPGKTEAAQPAPPQRAFQIQEAPESQLYAVSASRLIASTMLSGTFVAGVVMIIAIIVSTIVVWALAGADGFWALLVGVLPVGLILVTVIWGRFAGEFNFRAAVSPDGIRIRRGLAESRTETIPPRRIHGVNISQPLLWRIPGWYRVNITQAAKAAGEEGSMRFSSVLLPVGDKQEALLALWLVLPDLQNPEELFDQALHGKGKTPGWFGIPTRAWVFNPIVYKRAGIRLTENAVAVRSGRVTRFGRFAAYERIQCLIVRQGPLDKGLRLASILLGMVPGSFQVQISHLSSEDAGRVTAELTERSNVRRLAEPPEKWLARIEKEFGVDIPSTDEDAPVNETELPQPVPVQQDNGQHDVDNDRWRPQ